MNINNLFGRERYSHILLFCFLGTLISGLGAFGTNSSSSNPADSTHSKQPITNAAIIEFEPALAVRTSACITCHAKIAPGHITDFGYGDSYFFGKPGNGSRFGPFDGSIYGDFLGDPDKTGWLTAEFAGNVIVPKASLDFDMSAAGAKLPDVYRKPLQSRTLAEYLRALETQKARPATIIEKDFVFIGAPTAAALEARFQIAPDSGISFKYVKDNGASPDIKGIDLNPGKNYFTNTGDVVCDGDLFIRGSLFLNRGVVATRTGCRIYATGPIFVQNAVAYRNLGGPADKTNLQLVSAAAILLGLGDKSCDAAYKDSPLARRLISGYAVSSYFTRDASRRSISPKEFGQGVYDQGKLIPDLTDAGCQNDNLDFSKLLLNAPQVHNRYKGRFKGLVVAEVVLFRLGKSTFEFDPVFKEVSVLPKLKDSDYLEVE